MKTKLPSTFKLTNRPKPKPISSGHQSFRHRDRGTYAGRGKTQ